MAYKSLLTVVTDPSGKSLALDGAIDLARREDAHLDILCVGLDRTPTEFYYAGATANFQQETFDSAKADVQSAEAAVRARMAVEDVRWGVDAAVMQLGGLSAMVAQRARFVDLVVQSKPYGQIHPPEAETTIEAAMFEGGVPVLVLPDTGLGKRFAKRIVLAWNQSTESLHAVRAALPLLKAASLVNIAVIDPPRQGAERSDPGGPLSHFLSRHGVKTEISVLAKTLPRVSDVLCRHARDTDADLIVMGAYGHSRFREAILGGTTRYMLEVAEVPVFIAH